MRPSAKGCATGLNAPHMGQTSPTKTATLKVEHIPNDTTKTKQFALHLFPVASAFSSCRQPAVLQSAHHVANDRCKQLVATYLKKLRNCCTDSLLTLVLTDLFAGAQSCILATAA